MLVAVPTQRISDLLQKFEISRGAVGSAEDADVRAPRGNEASAELTESLKVLHIGPRSYCEGAAQLWSGIVSSVVGSEGFYQVK